MPTGFHGRPRHETGAEVQAQVLAACRQFGIEARRRNTGAARLPGKNGREQLVRFGQVGDPDIEFILPPTGRAGGIECKATGELPTIEQFRRILEINRAGGFAFWCDCVDMALSILPYAEPKRRIAYITIRQPVVTFLGEAVEGEILEWHGTEKQQRALAKKRANTRTSRASRGGAVLRLSSLPDSFRELIESSTTTNATGPKPEP